MFVKLLLSNVLLLNFLLAVRIVCLSANSNSPADIIQDEASTIIEGQDQTIMTPSQRLIQSRSIEPSISHVNPASATAAGYLFADLTDSRLNLSDPIDATLSKVLDRDGPDMRPSRDYKDYDDITMEVSKRAWRLLHKHASIAVRDRIDLALPLILEVLSDAEVSTNCRSSIEEVLGGAKRMESWAIKLLNSWGNFPAVGIFEGTYSELGSFHTCVNIPENKYIDHAHYCSITYRPVMPSRKNYELIVRKEPDELLRLFNKTIQNKGREATASLSSKSSRFDHHSNMRDAFEDLLEHSQYHHYVYYKLGTCFPIRCTPFDVRRIAKLMGRRNILMNGPVKCYSKFSEDYEEFINSTDDDLIINATANSHEKKRKLVLSIWDLNNGIFIWKPFFNKAQVIALSIILVATCFIALMTLIDLTVNQVPYLYNLFMSALRNKMNEHNECRLKNLGNINDNHHHDSNEHEHSYSLTATAAMMMTTNSTCRNELQLSGATTAAVAAAHSGKMRRKLTGFMSFVDDCSIITNGAQFFRVSQGQLKNDILCLNGIRCITMVWIIMTHTMMYNDWSAFGRTREVEKSVKSLISQPLFNGSYLVDTFFLMSGLLSAFTAFRHCQGVFAKFNSFAYIFGRWLRLTPQIFFVSMIYIVIPAVSYGPHWFPIVGEYSENCIDNWWINVLHLQAFYSKEKMCNFVTWWISIDFFYHFFALAIIWVVLLSGHKLGFVTIAILVASQVGWQTLKHFELSLPPNVLSTIPQTGAMWTEMTLGFFWTPYTHAVPFFFGFYVGYLMALKKKIIFKQLNSRRALIGWILSITLLLGQSYSTYWWVTGKANYPRLVSTIFYTICPIIWAGSLCWIIIACHHGYGGFVNRVLSWKIFIVLGKASYLVYLSHFQILFLFFGNQNLLLEPSELVMLYVIIGNITLATLYGIFLCIVFELPWLKMHRRLMEYV